MKYKFILIFFFLLPMSGFCQSSETKKVAIVEIVDKQNNIDFGIKLLLRGSLAEAVSHTPGYEAYDRNNLDRIMQEEKIQNSGLMDETTIQRLGIKVGASYILVVEAAYMGSEHGSLAVLANMTNVETAQITTVQSFGPVKDLDKICNDLTYKLFGIRVVSDNAGSTSSAYNNDSYSYNSRQGQDQTFTVSGVGFRMVYVQGGSFTMGATSEQGSDAESDEYPAHRVTLSDYYIGETEVTVGQFAAFVDATGYKTDADNGGGSYIVENGEWVLKSGVSWLCDAKGNYRGSSEYRHPVIHVSWNDAMAYCRWLSQKTGKTFTLPTEAQWEYAARGGRKSLGYEYSGSNNIESIAIYWNNYGQSNLNTATVKSKNANELGIYDMSGNVYEWCSDWYDENYYQNSPSTNPQGPATGSDRVLRGGSWFYFTNRCRVSHRRGYIPCNHDSTDGFRLALLP